jgi:hypothetical protein
LQRIVAGEIGELPVEAVDRSLQRQHTLMGNFGLVLVELRRIEIGDSERGGDRGFPICPTAWPGTSGIWNLLIAVPMIRLKRALLYSRSLFLLGEIV